MGTDTLRHYEGGQILNGLPNKCFFCFFYPQSTRTVLHVFSPSVRTTHRLAMLQKGAEWLAENLWQLPPPSPPWVELVPANKQNNFTGSCKHGAKYAILRWCTVFWMTDCGVRRVAREREIYEHMNLSGKFSLSSEHHAFVTAAYVDNLFSAFEPNSSRRLPTSPVSPHSSAFPSETSAAVSNTACSPVWRWRIWGWGVGGLGGEEG